MTYWAKFFLSFVLGNKSLCKNRACQIIILVSGCMFERSEFSSESK